MKVQQITFNENGRVLDESETQNPINANLVFIFGDRQQLQKGEISTKIQKLYPEAYLVGCSTSGEIRGTEVLDSCVIVSALEFEKTQIKHARVKLSTPDESRQCGFELGKELFSEDLSHVLIFAEGLNINGSALVEGLRSVIPISIGVTGGLAGDGSNFKETVVLNDDLVESNCIVGIGLYGKSITVGYGSLGGWDIFGPERRITRSDKHILYEIDGKSALALYKDYLGDHAKNLPASGLRFPLCVRKSLNDRPIIRTILGINEEDQSITFAGDVPEGSYAQLMVANYERLIDGAISAAETATASLKSLEADFALLISCVGRKLILQQRVEEEVEGVRSILGEHPKFAGFYSYGEISPFCEGAPCELHNQTMTITTFKEE